MAQANEGSGFRIVAREDYSDVTYMLEVAHPMMAKAAKPGQFVIVMEHEHGERIPLDHRRLQPRARHHHAGDPGGRQDHQGDAGQPARSATTLYAMVGPMGIPSHIGKREEGHLRRRRPRRRTGLSAGPRLQGKRRLRHRRHRLPQQGADVLARQVRRGVRRTDHLHRRRLGRHQGTGHRRHQAGRSPSIRTSTRSSRSARRS